MIRCSHCGKLAPKGAVSCQNCGMPLVNGGSGVTNAGQAEPQEQLPAWLESLRAHERPVSNGQENRQPFSMDELVDEDSMPSWMRQDRRKVPENGNSDSFPAIPVVPTNAEAERQNMLSNGFQAGSLIDERSLPAWMRESQGETGGGGQPGAAQNVSAHSLVDQQNLPAWIKDLSQAAQTQQSAAPAYQYNLPTQTQAPNKNPYNVPTQTPITPPTVANSPRVPQTPQAHEPPLTPIQSFSAHDLLDAQAMPSWMSGSQGPGAPPTRPVPIGQGFSAGELIDQRSVPQWMRDLQGQEKSDPQSALGVPVSGSGQTVGTNQGQQGTLSGEGMPASSLLEKNSMPSWLQGIQPGGSQATGQGPSMDANSRPAWLQENQAGGAQAPQAANELLDMNSMPTWMREGAQIPQPSQPAAPYPAQGLPAGGLLDMNSMPTWMREGAQNGAQGPQITDQGMAAGSLVDLNSMPAWMRNSDPGLTGSSNAGGRPGQVPARPVPSRPRNEASTQEQSEVAANVFSSMLGVAASTPTLPGQEYNFPNNMGGAQGQPGQPQPPFQQPQPPSWQQAGMPQSHQGAAPVWQMSDITPPSNPNAYPPAAQAGVMGAMGYPQNTEQPAWSYSATDRGTLGVSSGAGAGYYNPNPNPGNAQNTEPKKKGFFDSIRDFFSK